MSSKIVEGVIIGFLLLEAKVQFFVELTIDFQNMPGCLLLKEKNKTTNFTKGHEFFVKFIAENF
jgi:hypothetical protein